MPKLDRQSALMFIRELREARLNALGDAEGFAPIVHAIERLGSYLTKEEIGDKGAPGSLEKYRPAIKEHVSAQNASFGNRALATPFQELYELVQIARNDAVHQGAFARHLTGHAVQLALVLEDSLKPMLDLKVADFMIRDVRCAEMWQPLSFLRQQMLTNSFSYLPVWDGPQAGGGIGQWRLISDSALARFLGCDRKGTDAGFDCQ
ncbi:MAG: hypothetical protein IT162_07110 [Bryobacterales bacterium]|nr:hypothetical protein [Bryobacterales bacterium]